jgi:MFS family permease
MDESGGAWWRPSTPRSVLLYYIYKSTKAVEFYRPIMYLFFLAQGLSFTQIAVLEAIYNLTTVLGEVPTGYVGDRVGRRNSLLVGTTLISVTLVGIGLSSTFLALAVLYACWSMGYNFRSGSEDAWLYDTLTDDHSTEDFAAVRGAASRSRSRSGRSRPSSAALSAPSTSRCRGSSPPR